MRMEQRLTPQLIQSMSILQKPVAELEAMINEALESNAALELAEPESGGSTESEHASSNGRVESPPNEETTLFSRLDRFSRDYDLDFNEYAPHRKNRVSTDGDRDAKMAALANTEGRELGLHEYLREQWGLLEVDPPVRAAGEALIAAIDDDGYLRVRLEEIAAGASPPVLLQDIERALPLVQKLDPPGIAARDIVECLLLQLDLLPGDNTIERVLIQHHLDDLAHNRLPQIARQTGYTLGEITEALKVIRTHLHLHPGYLVGDRSVPPIRPDVIVDYAETGGGLIVRLTRGNTPELRIRDDVASLVKDRQLSKEAREFARRHVESATALIDAVRFRRSRLLDVARAIAERQRDFFDIGPAGLKVFRMSDLAEELGCDPSTISRTVAEKYMQTPRGIYPLRYFFTGGTESADGESLGWDRVKIRVKELVDSEDRKNPLNDDEIADRLAKEGITLSRRTVAKYRAQLNIPTARQRRQF